MRGNANISEPISSSVCYFHGRAHPPLRYSATLLPHHLNHHSMYSPSSRAADISRLLDPPSRVAPHRSSPNPRLGLGEPRVPCHAPARRETHPRSRPDARGRQPQGQSPRPQLPPPATSPSSPTPMHRTRSDNSHRTNGSSAASGARAGRATRPRTRSRARSGSTTV